jgi:prolyl-tRNA synthetase
MNMYNAVAGANEKDVHYKNVNPKRDFKDVIVTDLRLIKEGDPCPHCGQPVHMTRGIEAGQVFTLGTKYSEALHATFLDENGREKPLVMGCYGIGVSRTMAASIEQNNDAHGIIWPRAIAPYEVVVVPVNAKVPEQLGLAEEIYDDLRQAGVDVLLDDRKDRAGVKFKDADLIGYPLRITVGPKSVEENQIEIRVRRTGETLNFAKEDYMVQVLELLGTL